MAAPDSATPVSMPKLGMTMEEGTVVQWPIALGARVAKGETLLVIESEKAEVEIEAAASGCFRHIFVPEGETVPCGTLLAALTERADTPFDAQAFHAAENRPEAPKGAGELTVAAAPAAVHAEAAAAPAARAARAPIAPAARAAARKLGLDPEAIPGTGPGGRVTKQDVEAFAAARAALTRVEDGVGLEVLEQGQGDRVLLLPGFGTDVSAFARQLPLLAERHRVFALNPRGVGLSDAPALEAYTVARAAADAAAVAAQPAHVIGASLGAAVALELAISHPERVRSLTLITPFVTATPRLLAVSAAWCRLAAEASPEALATALLPWFFSSGFLADLTARERTLRGLTQTLRRVPAQTLTRAAAGMQAWSGTRADALEGIGVPTLVIAAGEDLLTPGGAAIAQAIPGARCVEIAGAGHAVALEAPDAVNSALIEHLSGGDRS